MKLLLHVLAIGLLPSVCAAREGSAVATKTQQPRGFFFTENKGQISDQDHKFRADIDFSLPGKGFNMFVGDGRMHYQFDRLDNAAEVKKHYEDGMKDPAKRMADVNEQHTIYRVDVELLGANIAAPVVAGDRQDYYEMYYTENTPESGARANTYGKVVYKDVYPNIDWVLYSKNNEFKYEFIVHAGGNPANIKLKYSGASSLKVAADGGLLVTTPLGTINDQAPVSFDATGKKVASSFSLSGDVLSFNVGSYDGELTIDPTLVWGTYYGGNTTDFGFGAACNRSGSEVYLSGYINSSNVTLSTTGAHQQTYTTGNSDAFLVQFNASGARQWATYYGGSGAEQGTALAVDPSGNVFMVGFSNTSGGTAIATTGSQQASFSGGSYDGFLVKFNNSGVRQWATYCGGTINDQAYSVACDANGNVAIAGYTESSTNISTPFAFDPTVANGDGFAVKYNSSGARLWGTYFGSSDYDYGYGVCFDKSGHLYVAGRVGNGSSAVASDVVATGSHQSAFGGGQDGYVIKLDGSQGTRLWATLYGGTNTDYGYSIGVDDSNNVFFCGTSFGTNAIATSGGYQTTMAGVSDAFLVKFDSAGARKWGTYFGGNSDDYPYNGAMKVDLNNNIYFAGYTLSTSGIGNNGLYNSNGGNYDGFVVKFLPNGQLDWASYYGGTSTDYIYGLAADVLGNIYIAGPSASSNQIAQGGFQNSNGGNYDAYIAKIRDCALPVQPGVITGATTVCQGNTQTYSISAVTGATSYTWSLPNGWTGTSTTTSITVTPGITSGLVRVRANVACGGGEYRTLAVTVLPAPGATITTSGPSVFCAGGNVTLTANTGTGYTYVWKNGTTVLGTTTNAHVATVIGSYTVDITNPGNGCTSYSAPKVVTVNPLPVINFPAFAPGCTNHPVINMAATPTGGTYTGAGVTGTTLNLMTAGPGVHTINYAFTDSNGCSSNVNRSITINPAPVVNFPALSTICADVLVPLNMATPPGGVYTGTGVTGTNFSPFVSGAGTFNVTYTYTDNNNCVVSQVQPQTVNPLTSVNFPSITPKCVDAPAVTLIATPAGGTFSGQGVYSGNQFTPATGVGNHIIHYDYTNTYGCITRDSETIVVNGLPVLTFPAMDSICNNAPFTMMASPAGGTYTGPGTGTGNVLDPMIAGVGTHTINYAYTDANSCSNTISRNVLIQPQPQITSQPYIYLEVCQNEALATNVGATNAGSYQWQHNSVNIAGANSDTYVLPNAQPSNSGNYQVMVSGVGSCANIGILSTSTAVLVNPNPPVNLTPGNSAICNGDSLMLNSGLTSGMTYIWRRDGQNIAGANGPTYQATQAGTYKVIVVNQNTGCDSSSATGVVLTVNPAPDATITYNGPTTFCQGEDLQITATDVTNNMTYQWTNNGNNIGGANSGNYSANATGAYAVVLTNSFNCVRTSNTVNVTTNPLPTPVVTVLDNQLHMSTGQYDNYQWNLNGNAIQGANGREYQGTVSGNYTVTVRDANGCEGTSSSINPTAVSNVVKGGNITLYPNPNTGTFNIEGAFAAANGKATIEVVDAAGKLIFREEVKVSGDKLSTKVDVSGIASGAYMIRIVSDNAREVIPFVKR